MPESAHPDHEPPVTSNWDHRGPTLALLLQRVGSVIESEICGRSMSEALPDRARIRISCLVNQDYRPGTVIAFMTPAGLVGHRVVAVGRDRRAQALLFTRGDATVICDRPVQAEWVLGEVTEWSDGQVWCPVPSAEVMGAGRRLSAALVLSLVRLVATMSTEMSARISGLLLRVALRQRTGPGSPGSP